MVIQLWTRLSNFGIDHSLSMIAARKAILTNQLAYITFVVVFGMNIAFIFIESVSFDAIGLASSLVILSTPLLNKLGYHKVAAFIFAIMMPISLTLFSSVNKTLVPPPIPLEVYIFPKVFLLSFLIIPLVIIDAKSKWLLPLAIMVNLACIYWVDSLNKSMGVGLDFSMVSFDSFNRLNYLIIFPIIILISGFIFLNHINNKSEEQILAQNNKLEKANHKINKINSDLTNSIQYAQRIQNALLPEKEHLNRYFTDSFVYYKPRDIVSGDFYFFKKTKTQGKNCLALVCADCTGHGVPGGFMSILSMSHLNEIIRDDHFCSAADILNQLREQIKVALNQTGKPDEQRDGIELSLILYYPELKQMEFAGARRPVYLIKNNSLQVFKGDNMPIGIYLNERVFTNTTHQLEGGEMIYLFTDGITDQVDSKGKRLMTTNLKKWLLLINNQNGAKQQKALANQMNQWMEIDSTNPAEQIDDMLLIGFRIPG
ncbi:MAG: PP2C family protein-serine/threonine phosphatase [Salinivirgaceae bacterium]